MSLATSLLSGAVGGLLIMLVQNHLRNRKEESDKAEELRGLIRIVDAEMSSNDDILQEAITVDLTTASGAQLSPVLGLRRLKADDWDRTKVRLAQLASEDYFVKLHDYYEQAREVAERAHAVASGGGYISGQLAPVQDLARGCIYASDMARSKSVAVLHPD